MRADLHLHTTVSDGLVAPADVVRRAAEGGLALISVTDHDTAAGVRAAQAAAEGTGLNVIPGTELSSSLEGREIHILGYGIDPDAPQIQAHHELATARRRQRMYEMLQRLADVADIHLEMADVEAAADEQTCMIGRPHLAQALVAAGHADDIGQAFDTLIGDGHPAFVPTALGTPAEAIAVIRDAGGIAVWAHPPMDLVDDLTSALVDAGLSGLEAYRPTWTARRVRRVSLIAESYGIVLTGGSDWHGRPEHGAPGDFWVRWGQIRPFLELLAETGTDVLQAVDASDELA